MTLKAMSTAAHERRTPFRYRILHVALPGSQPEMGRIPTGRIITAMADIMACGDRPFKDQKGCDMDPNLLCIADAELAVAFARFSSRPGPTIIICDAERLAGKQASSQGFQVILRHIYSFMASVGIAPAGPSSLGASPSHGTSRTVRRTPDSGR